MTSAGVAGTALGDAFYLVHDDDMAALRCRQGLRLRAPEGSCPHLRISWGHALSQVKGTKVKEHGCVFSLLRVHTGVGEADRLAEHNLPQLFRKCPWSLKEGVRPVC